MWVVCVSNAASGTTGWDACVAVAHTACLFPLAGAAWQCLVALSHQQSGLPVWTGLN